MVTEATRSELKAYFQHVILIPFDKTKLDNKLDQYVKQTYPYEQGEYFTTLQPLALIKNTSLIIDQECIIEKIRGTIYPVEVYGERRKGEQVLEQDLFPRYTLLHSIDDLIKNVGLPETSIVKFMASRFAYNDRIAQNMRLVLKEIGILATY